MSFLSPASLLYGSATAFRNRLYDHGVVKAYQSPLPVVSVGNLTAGGSGKTPLVLHLAALLAGKGYRPVIVSRGYKGATAGPKTVDAEADSAEVVGDEPLLMARRAGVPVIVSRRRAEGARFISREKLGDVIILDDGLQHRALARNIDILAVDCSSAEAIQAFLKPRLLPEGRFREDRDAALRRIQLAILNHRAPKLESLDAAPIRQKLQGRMPVFESFVVVSSVRPFEGQAALQPGANIVAFCALANPDGFFKTVSSLRSTVVERVAAADHREFGHEELRRIAAKHPEAALVCTEKDAVKLPLGTGLPIFVLETKLALDREDAFLDELMRRVGPPVHSG